MKYILDTNICIYIIKNNPLTVVEKFKQLTPDDIGISSITLAELQYGVEKSQHQEKNRKALQHFILPLEVIAFDDNAAVFYGNLRAQLEKKGQPIGCMDLMIAAHVKSLQLTLVTNNLKEFSKVSELLLENWI